jgi:hypothetical protein
MYHTEAKNRDTAKALDYRNDSKVDPDQPKLNHSLLVLEHYDTANDRCNHHIGGMLQDDPVIPTN